jgi:hypothetical protein
MDDPPPPPPEHEELETRVEEPSTGDDSSMLTAEEARVLGCLMEKAKTTPDHYPLTMNSLVAACNQKSNRFPVVDYNDIQVGEVVASLRAKHLALHVTMAGSRVSKYQHCFERAYPDVGTAGEALMTVLLLRGRQTLGELRSRTERMFRFESLDDVQDALDELVCYPPRQLVREIPPGGGHRVPTFIHLLCGDAETDLTVAGERVAPATPPDNDWKERIEDQLATLRREIESLRQELGL